MILRCAICSVIDGLSLEDLKLPSFSCQNWHTVKPTISMITTELKRREPGIRGIENTKLNGLLKILKAKKDVLSEDDVVYIKQEYNKYKSICVTF